MGYNVAVFVRTIAQLKDIIESEPFKGQNKEGTSFLVTFLASAPEKFPVELPTTIPKSTAQVISSKGSGSFQRNPWRRRRSAAKPIYRVKTKSESDNSQH